MINKKIDRRTFITKYIGLSSLYAAAGICFENCTSKNDASKEKQTFKNTDPCQDLNGVSAEEIQKRENLGYVTASPIADNKCNNCNLYLPPGEQGCGACMLFKGPVEAEGYCTYWAPKV